MHGGIGTRLAADGPRLRYSCGDIPNLRVKLEVNEPTLVSPTCMQMSATV
jgi:hypothetical protein